jgi:C1A family cysteine protease
MISNNKGESMYKLNWTPDRPDIRDYTTSHNAITNIIEKAPSLVKTLPPAFDARKNCSEIVDQSQIGSCTANAAAGMVEFLENRLYGKHYNASRRFIYKATRDLLHWTGDVGAYLRTTMGSLVLFGAPPEEYFPYNDQIDEVPPAFCYSFANNFKAAKYLRLDNANKDTMLYQIKFYLLNGYPSIFGFTVYDSISQANETGFVPFPISGDKAIGGHAVMICGWNDNLSIYNTQKAATTGAFIIRNSWGTGWGYGGYGFLPYEYVKQGQASDFWTMISQGWIDLAPFI